MVKKVEAYLLMAAVEFCVVFVSNVAHCEIWGVVHWQWVGTELVLWLTMRRLVPNVLICRDKLAEVRKQKEQLERRMQQCRRDDDLLKNKWLCPVVFMFRFICEWLLCFYSGWKFVMFRKCCITVGGCLHCSSGSVTSSFVKKAREIVNVSCVYFYLTMYTIIL